MPKQILVVDDHRPTVALVRSGLEARGFSVSTARNGAECLLSVDKKKPDLVILDINMPVMDGFQTLRVLRENEKTKRLPVIILTVRRRGADLLEGTRAEADAYLAKPFGLSALLAVVEKVLPRDAERSR